MTGFAEELLDESIGLSSRGRHLYREPEPDFPGGYTIDVRQVALP